MPPMPEATWVDREPSTGEDAIPPAMHRYARRPRTGAPNDRLELAGARNDSHNGTGVPSIVRRKVGAGYGDECVLVESELSAAECHLDSREIQLVAH